MIDYIAAFFVAGTGVLLVLAKMDFGDAPRGVRMAAQALLFAQAASCLYAGWMLAFG